MFNETFRGKAVWSISLDCQCPVGAAFGGCAILPKWEEYIAKREIELTQSTEFESENGD